MTLPFATPRASLRSSTSPPDKGGGARQLAPFFLMRVLILRTCCAQQQHLEEGKVYDLDSIPAAALIRMGRAVEAPKEEPKPKAAPRKPKATLKNATD